LFAFNMRFTLLTCLVATAISLPYSDTSDLDASPSLYDPQVQDAYYDDLDYEMSDDQDYQNYPEYEEYQDEQEYQDRVPSAQALMNRRQANSLRNRAILSVARPVAKAAAETAANAVTNGGYDVAKDAVQATRQFMQTGNRAAGGGGPAIRTRRDANRLKNSIIRQNIGKAFRKIVPGAAVGAAGGPAAGAAFDFASNLWQRVRNRRK
jgi:hypothetical protein